MSTDKTKSPEMELDKKDHGDDTQRRFRYQSIWAAILSLSLLDEESEFTELYCEHHEDILVKRYDGTFIGVQVKTREIEKGPFKTGDKAIKTSLKKFIELERDYPGLFSKFVLVTNCGFWKEKQNKSNLRYLLEKLKAEQSSVVLNASEFSIINNLAKDIPKTDYSIIYNTLTKSELQVATPGLDEIQYRLDRQLVESSDLKDRRYDEIRKVSNVLIARMFQASSISLESSKKDFFALLKDPESEKNQAIIDNKKITKEIIQDIIQETISDETLLRTYESVLLSELPKGMEKLELKMAAGGISAQNIDLSKDYKYSTEVLLEKWLYKYGSECATERYEHLSTIVRTECQESYDTKYSDSNLFGLNVLKDLRNRLRIRHNQNNKNLFKCNYEHLLGIAGILTEECKVWWSKKFIIEEEE